MAAKRMMKKLTRTRKTTKIDRSSLILSSNAYEKLLWFRNQKDTEVGAMGISLPDDPLHICDFSFLPQECTSVSTDFDPEAQDAWMDEMMIDKKLSPEQFTRVWAHTHPSQSASPSGTDWDTFQEIMGNMPWGVMLILGTSNEFSCVFRVKEQMLNMPVLTTPHEVNSDWVTELENIKKPKPRSTAQQSWIGYDNDWEYMGQGGHNYGKAKKKDKKPELLGWEPAKKPTWSTFKNAVDKLSNNTPYPQLNKWLPAFEEVMSLGPCRSISLLKEAFENITTSHDTEKVEAMADALSYTMTEDISFLRDYDPDYTWEYDALSFLHAVRKSKNASQDYPLNQHRELYEHIEIAPGSDGKKQWFVLPGDKYAQAIPDMLASPDWETFTEGFSACIACVNYFPEYCETIDKYCREFVEKFLQHQQEYDQLQTEHEMNVTDDIQVL